MPTYPRNQTTFPKAGLVDWRCLIADIQEENILTTLGIGQWFHNEPCMVPDCRKDGLTRAFELLGVEARYNTRSSRAEVRHESFPEGWRTMNDRLAAELREVLTARFVYVKKVRERPISAADQKLLDNAEALKKLTPDDRAALLERMDPKNRRTEESAPLTFGRDAWADTFNSYLYDREVDPFAEWLDALPKWDRVDRLNGWLAQVFTINDPNGLVEWTSRFICLGAVTRAYSPGAKLDEMPVLIGRGGIGKSTALRYILPQDAHYPVLYLQSALCP